MLQAALHMVATFLAVSAAIRYAHRWPFLTTFAMICAVILIRRGTAWLATSKTALAMDWVIRSREDITILNNVILPLLTTVFILVFIVETSKYLGPFAVKRQGVINGVAKHG